MKQCLQYWKHAQVLLNLTPGAVLDHCAGEQLGRGSIGDVIWVVTLRNGELLLVGRMMVGEILTDRQARRRFGRVYEATTHLVAEAGTEEPYRLTSLVPIADQLRFVSPTGRDRLATRDGRVDGKQLQALRVLRPETVAVLEALWSGEPSEETRVVESPISSGAGFGDPETNKKVETAAVAHVARKYREDGWEVESVEALKCGFDLRCGRGGLHEHVEIKGVGGEGVSFIITANEVRHATEDPDFVLCVVTSALSAAPQVHRYTGQEFLVRFRLNSLAFRASPR